MLVKYNRQVVNLLLIYEIYVSGKKIVFCGPEEIAFAFPSIAIAKDKFDEILSVCDNVCDLDDDDDCYRGDCRKFDHEDEEE